MTDKTVADLAAETKAAFDTRFDELKAIAVDALGKAEAGEPLAEGAKQKADEAIVAVNEAKARLDELEQRVASQRSSDESDEVKSLGQQFVDSESAKKMLEDGSSFRGRASMETKATLTLATSASAGSVGDGVRSTRLAGIDLMPRQQLYVRDLISPGQMDGNTIEYVKQTGYTRNAGMVAEGAAKPQSDIQIDLISTSAKVIAHYMKASRQSMDDVAGLRSLIDDELIYGLKLKEDSQLLNGDNTGQNLYGIVPQATAYSAPITISDLNIMDVLRLAMLQASLAERPATGHVMHPTDWAQIETLKDTIGRYIIGDPQGRAIPTLWGLPVVATVAMTQRKFLTGAFKGGAQLFDRWAARVELATENEDDFIKNLVTILAEERLALAVKRPEAFIYGDFDTALAA